MAMTKVHHDDFGRWSRSHQIAHLKEHNVKANITVQMSAGGRERTHDFRHNGLRVKVAAKDRARQSDPVR